MPHRSPGGDEPTDFARLTVVTVPLSPGELDDIEQPTSLAKLTVMLEPLSVSEPAEVEQPSHLAEWIIAVEPVPPWDESQGPFPPVPPGEPWPAE